MPTHLNALGALEKRIEACTACPRLVRHCTTMARTKRLAYQNETYHGRPVAGFGDPEAPIVIVGLAPGAHGANRTGRVFTGDKSGDFLFASLHREKLASQPTSVAKNDSLTLTGVFITLAARCAPPDNKPSRIELKRCTKWLDEELALLSAARVYLALGLIAFNAVVQNAKRHGIRLPRAPQFAHGAEVTLGSHVLLASYHVSQQNTSTGKLTPAMFDAIVARAKAIAKIHW